MAGDSERVSRAEQEVAAALLDAGAVNFDEIGKALAEHGPKLAREGIKGAGRADLDPWEVFCGTMRYYVRVYRLPPIFPGGLEDLGKLGQVGGELHQ